MVNLSEEERQELLQRFPNDSKEFVLFCRFVHGGTAKNREYVEALAACEDNMQIAQTIVTMIDNEHIDSETAKRARFLSKAFPFTNAPDEKDKVKKVQRYLRMLLNSDNGEQEYSDDGGDFYTDDDYIFMSRIHGRHSMPDMLEVLKANMKENKFELLKVMPNHRSKIRVSAPHNLAEIREFNRQEAITVMMRGSMTEIRSFVGSVAPEVEVMESPIKKEKLVRWGPYAQLPIASQRPKKIKGAYYMINPKKFAEMERLTFKERFIMSKRYSSLHRDGWIQLPFKEQIINVEMPRNLAKSVTAE